jgi:DNA-binding protein YbaB
VTEIKGASSRRGVSVEVHPGGALSALSLSPAALDLGAAVLAATVVETVASATAQANQRTKHALRTALDGLDLSVLGLSHSAALTEQVESTVPDTWRAQ